MAPYLTTVLSSTDEKPLGCCNPRNTTTLITIRATVITGKRSVGMLSLTGNTGRPGRRQAACHTGCMAGRTAHPYRDLDVIDSRAPRFNQAVIGSPGPPGFPLR